MTADDWRRFGLALVTVGGVIVSAVGLVELVKAACPPPAPAGATSKAPTNIMGV